MNTSLLNYFKQFITFVSLFIGTGFIAGSIVHFGEGVTIWDSGVLILGLLLFVGASYVQEYGKHHKRSTPGQFILFIFQSLLLAIGIGMASGGTQHFIDTPEYSSVLIPLGISIGVFSFFWREEVSLSFSKWLSVFASVCVSAVIIWGALNYFNQIIPDTLRVGHGSHGHSTSENKPLEDLSVGHFDQEHVDDGHGH